MGSRRKKIILSWSGGKESALSLFELKSPEWEIVGLLTTFVEGNPPRVQMQELPIEIIRAQAASLQLPLHEVLLPPQASNAVYEQKLGEKIQQLKKEEGLRAIAFGDRHLQDVRDYRDQFFSSLEIETAYPVWGWKPDFVRQAFAGLGHQAVVHCIEKSKIPPAFLGRLYNSSFVDDLPRGVDECGENGEFHTFVFDGPFFQSRVPFSAGQVYEKAGFVYQEILLSEAQNARHN